MFEIIGDAGKVMVMENSYPNMRRIVYEGGATFIPVCEKCHQFVKADDTVSISYSAGLADTPNAMCSKCGRTKMIFEGFI